MMLPVVLVTGCNLGEPYGSDIGSRWSPAGLQLAMAVCPGEKIQSIKITDDEEKGQSSGRLIENVDLSRVRGDDVKEFGVVAFPSRSAPNLPKSIYVEFNTDFRQVAIVLDLNDIPRLNGDLWDTRHGSRTPTAKFEPDLCD